MTRIARHGRRCAIGRLRVAHIDEGGGQGRERKQADQQEWLVQVNGLVWLLHRILRLTGWLLQHEHDHRVFPQGIQSDSFDKMGRTALTNSAMHQLARIDKKLKMKQVPGYYIKLARAIIPANTQYRQHIKTKQN